MLLEEAHALGLDLADLIAADTTGGERIPTLEAYIEAVASTFSPATAATYRPYWRLAAARLGDRRLVEITTVDLAAVVTDAVVRAQQARPASPGRASQEHCVAALRALFRLAAAAGLITANPATALNSRGESGVDAGPSMTARWSSSSTPCEPPATTPTSTS